MYTAQVSLLLSQLVNIKKLPLNVMVVIPALESMHICQKFKCRPWETAWTAEGFKHALASFLVCQIGLKEQFDQTVITTHHTQK